MEKNTIVAVASGPGPSGVAVVRVSGPQVSAVLAALSCRGLSPRKAALCKLLDTSGEEIDRALVLWFPAPHSFTGEDVCEFHVHGGSAVVADTIAACLAVSGVRLAQAGEFTRRAFLNNKMDLSAAEGLGDLIEAETAAQRRQALRQMEGGLATEVMAWREEIIAALAEAEGDIDFPDEDLPEGLTARSRARVSDLVDRLRAQLAGAERAERVRDGFKVTILGAPNAGKSSLLNVLAKREAAITSEIAGTTRDIVEIRLVLDGAVVWVSDTAGLRESDDLVEAEGVRRALERADSSDLRIGVISSEAERMELSSLIGADDVWALSKADIIDWGASRSNEIAISSRTGLGVEALEALISKHAQQDLVAGEAAPLTRLRHKEAVTEAIEALERALGHALGSTELIAEDLRLATRALGRITGRVDMDEVLDRIFAQFCIGK